MLVMGQFLQPLCTINPFFLSTCLQIYLTLNLLIIQIPVLGVIQILLLLLLILPPMLFLQLILFLLIQTTIKIKFPLVKPIPLEVLVLVKDNIIMLINTLSQKVRAKMTENHVDDVPNRILLFR